MAAMTPFKFCNVTNRACSDLFTDLKNSLLSNKSHRNHILQQSPPLQQRFHPFLAPSPQIPYSLTEVSQRTCSSFLMLNSTASTVSPGENKNLPSKGHHRGLSGTTMATIHHESPEGISEKKNKTKTLNVSESLPSIGDIYLYTFFL